MVNPPFADHRLTFALSLARAARYPALEELYFNGPHHGNFAFEVGNPNLEAEHALGIDASLRWRSPRFSAEATLFRNDIANFIFRNPVEDPDEDMGHEGHGDEELPVVEFTGRDSVLQGVELHGDLHLTDRWFLDFGLDYVRGWLEDTNEALPRMPPLRGRLGMRYQVNALTLGGEWTSVARQARVFGAETATDGAGLLRLHASYSFAAGGATNTITARVENATDARYRNHLSYVKDVVPEMGRTFKLVYRVDF